MYIKDKIISCCEKVKKFISKAEDVLLFKTKSNYLNGLIYAKDNEIDLESFHF